MREFDKPIGRVWRRMRFQRFLGASVWCLAGTLAVAAVAIGVEKGLNRPLPGADWWPFAIAAGVGLTIAALIALLTGPSRVDAALAIDHAFHLNERLTTTLTLPADLRESSAGRALMADTLKHVNDLDIGSRFMPSLPRRAWVPIVPGLLAVGLLFLPELTQRAARASKAADAVDQKVVAKQVQALKKNLAQKRDKLDKNEFAKTDKLLAEIEKAADQISKAPPAKKEQALVKLNELTDALKDRQKQLGGSEQISKQLQQLKQMSSTGPADKFAKDLAKGDFDKAGKELQKLQEKLASGKMTEQEKKELNQQLKEMQKQLQDLANLEKRKKQLEEAKKNGSMTEQQFQQQMKKLNDQAKEMKKLQQLADKLGQAQQNLAKGDMKKAAEAMGMGQKDLENLAKQMSDLETLSDALADLQDAKSGMNNDGMNQVGNRLDDMANFMQGNNGNGNGNGLGRGRGRGDRPEAAEKTSSYNTKVGQQYTKGKAILEGFGSPKKQVAGESVIDVQGAMDASGVEAADALSNQKVPKNVRRHITGYFDEVRKGQ